MADVKNLTVGTTTYNIIDDGAARTSHSHTLSSPLSNVSIPNIAVSVNGSSVSSVGVSLASNAATASGRVPYVSSVTTGTRVISIHDTEPGLQSITTAEGGDSPVQDFYTYPSSATTNASVNTASITLSNASYITTANTYGSSNNTGGKFSYTSSSQTLTYTDPSWTQVKVVSTYAPRTNVHTGTTATTDVVKSFTPSHLYITSSTYNVPSTVTTNITTISSVTTSYMSASATPSTESATWSGTGSVTNQSMTFTNKSIT